MVRKGQVGRALGGSAVRATDFFLFFGGGTWKCAINPWNITVQAPNHLAVLD